MSREYIFLTLINVCICRFCLYTDIEEYCFRGAGEEVSDAMRIETSHGWSPPHHPMTLADHLSAKCWGKKMKKKEFACPFLLISSFKTWSHPSWKVDWKEKHWKLLGMAAKWGPLSPQDLHRVPWVWIQNTCYPLTVCSRAGSTEPSGSGHLGRLCCPPSTTWLSKNALPRALMDGWGLEATEL